MNKKIAITFAIGITISVATLYLAFKDVPFADLVGYLSSINYFWVLPTVVVILICFVLRAIRWQFILNSNHHISFWRAYHPLMIGFMINCVLPGRVGEVARPVILKANESIPFTTGLATVAAERVFDLAILIIVFVVLFAGYEIDPNLGIPFGDHVLNSDTLRFVFKGLLRLSVLLLIGIALVSLEKTRFVIKWCIRLIPKLFFLASPRVKELLQKGSAPPWLQWLIILPPGFLL